MKTYRYSIIVLFALLFVSLVACSAAPASNQAVTPTYAFDSDWFNMELTDAQTGKTFKVNDFSGKVVLVETMAMWCPNCLIQAGDVRKLHELLGDRGDFVSLSLDVDVNEDQASLKEYTEQYGFEWQFAVAPKGVARALGNLYSAEYLNPPLSPMLIIDRNGEVHHLKYGRKTSEYLLEVVEPYLAP